MNNNIKIILKNCFFPCESDKEKTIIQKQEASAILALALT